MVESASRFLSSVQDKYNEIEVFIRTIFTLLVFFTNIIPETNMIDNSADLFVKLL